MQLMFRSMQLIAIGQGHNFLLVTFICLRFIFLIAVKKFNDNHFFPAMAV